MADLFWRDEAVETIVRGLHKLKRRRQVYRVRRVIRLLHMRRVRRRGLHDWAARSVASREFTRELIAKLKGVP